MIRGGTDMSKGWVLLALALATGGGIIAAMQAGAHATAETRPLIRQTSVPARSSSCNRPPAGGSYHYPVKPFRRQHPIRGFFGDPRTVSQGQFGRDTPLTSGSFTFHNGVDIVAPTGTAVYPVESGVVVEKLYADEVTVRSRRSDMLRTFQYYHINPRVPIGQRVIAYRTILGTIRPHWLHVHLTEIDGFRAHNPLDPGHLEPYHDHTVPSVDQLLFRSVYGNDLDPQRLHGRVRIVADAEDLPPMPVPGEWLNFPVTPALVSWRLTGTHGRVVEPTRVAVDFRRTEPDNGEFWNIYAPGTYQNFPDFGHHLFTGRPGRYLFNLTHAPLDTRHLHDGRYVLTVTAADVCGNAGSIAQEIRINNRG
jgi:hypothetical protein